MNLFKVSLLLLLLMGYLTSGAQPNVILILTDDLDYITTGPFFMEILPEVEKMKTDGVEFTRFYTSSSSCCPSRAAILTGRYGYETGVLNNSSKHGGGWEKFRNDEHLTLSAYLQQAGYRTALLGKYLNGYGTIEKNHDIEPIYGWDYGFVSVGNLWKAYQGYDYTMLEWKNGKPVSDTTWQADMSYQSFGKKSEDYLTDVLTQRSINFIKENTNGNQPPFFMMVCPTAPHIPLGPAPRHEQLTKEKWLNHPAPNFPNTFSDNGMVNSKQFHAKPADKPHWLRKTWRKRMRQKKGHTYYYNWVSLNRSSKGIKNYKDVDWYYRMGSMYAVNDLIKTIKDTLVSLGEWDNTILIFTSDNGYQFGSHGLYQKSSPYEESTRVPFVITAGKNIDLSRGTKVGELGINVDIAPTVLNLTGNPVPEIMNGKSLAPFITEEDKSAFTRNSVLLEYDGPGLALDVFPMWMFFHLQMVPSYLLDLPPYKSLVIDLPDSLATGQIPKGTYKYVEWIKKPKSFRKANKNLTDLHQQLQLWNDSKKEYELYHLSADPYELDNLLYSQPEKFNELTANIKQLLFKQYMSRNK